MNNTLELFNKKLKTSYGNRLVVNYRGDKKVVKFCTECNSVLIPRNSMLYCKARDKEFELGNDSNGYKIVKKITHDDKENAPIIAKENARGMKISAQERKAFEDYF